MPSFDVISKFDKHEATNALDQANREVKTRFDFKDSRLDGQTKYVFSKGGASTTNWISDCIFFNHNSICLSIHFCLIQHSGISLYLQRKIYSVKWGIILVS